MKRVLWMDSGMITQQSKYTYCHWNVYLTMVCCSVAQSWPTLCDSMDSSTPDFPVLHHLLDFAQTLVLWVSDAITILSSVLLLLPSVFSSTRVFFSNELALGIRWPKYWSFSFSIIPFSENSGLISFRIDWFDLLVVQGILELLLEHHSSKVSIFQRSA